MPKTKSFIFILVNLTSDFTHSKLFTLEAFSYNRHRLDKIRNLRWEIGPVLPNSIETELSYKENEYYTQYNQLIDEYNEEFGFDITTDLDVRGFIFLFLLFCFLFDC